VLRLRERKLRPEDSSKTLELERQYKESTGRMAALFFWEKGHALVKQN